MAMFSPEQLDGFHHSIRYGGTMVPSREEMQATQATDVFRTGVITDWFPRHREGVIHAGELVYQFQEDTIISGTPSVGAACKFRSRSNGPKYRPSALDIEIE